MYCFDFGHLSVKSARAAAIQHIIKSDPGCLKLTIQSKELLWKNFTLGLHFSANIFKDITAPSNHDLF